jgi:DNA-binding NtrC family response regulator
MKPEIQLSALLVDDDKNICRTLSLSLRDQGCTVEEANSVPQALEKLKRKPYDVVLTDFRMEKQTGLELIQQGKPIQPEASFIVMTAYASFENAVAVVKEGAFEYLPKPFTSVQLGHLLNKVRTVVHLQRENRELKGVRSKRNYFEGLTSPASARLEEFVRKVAPTEGTILLVGESGTGKSELSRLIHELSPRVSRPFITVNCTTLAESLLESELFGHVKGAFTGATQDKAGKLELAAGGTLFLDEIGDLSLGGQAKLLRFLQDRVFEPVGSNKEISVDARIIAATNKNLEETVALGKFREDLYYRLNMLECKLLPLRFRREDLEVLILRLCREIEARLGPNEHKELPAAVGKAILAYSWPGNVRELRNVLERLYLLSKGRQIQTDDLPESVLSGAKPSLGHIYVEKTLQEIEREHIRTVLSHESNLERASEVLGITTVTLWRKRKEYGLP